MHLDLESDKPDGIQLDGSNVLLLGACHVASTEIKLWGVGSGSCAAATRQGPRLTRLPDPALVLVRMTSVATHAAAAGTAAVATAAVGDVHVYDVASYTWPLAECILARRTSRALVAPIAEVVTEPSIPPLGAFGGMFWPGGMEGVPGEVGANRTR